MTTLEIITEMNMDTDAYTCGQCRHGNFCDQCGECEDDYEHQRKAVTRQKLGEAWAPWMDKKLIGFKGGMTVYVTDALGGSHESTTTAAA